MNNLYEALKRFTPCNEQETKDKAIMLEWLEKAKTPFTRENEIAHFTASAWIINQDRTKVLMVWHNIYKSWSWTGGHADGETNLLQVAIREAQEETGIKTVHPVSEEIFSIETIAVASHEKKGKYIPSHLHMNVTYLLEADDSEALCIKADENSNVGWIPISELAKRVAEPWMMERVYTKLICKMKE